MEDRKKSRARSRNTATNSVARQFSPSRIETVLLTRLFDLASQPCGDVSGRAMRSTELIAGNLLPMHSASNRGISMLASRKGA